MIILSKGLTGGYASIACVLYSEKLSQTHPTNVIEPDQRSHGGHPFASTAGLAAIQFIEDQHLVEQADRHGRQFGEGLQRLAAKYPQIIEDAPAIGLMTGLRLRGAVYEALLSMQLGKRGIHAGNSMNEKAANPVLRLYPPLQIDLASLDHVLAMLDESLAQIAKMPPLVIRLLKPLIHHLYKAPNDLLRWVEAKN